MPNLRRTPFLVLLASTLVLLAVAMAFSPGDAATDCVRCDAGWYERIATKGYPDIPPGGDLGHWNGPDVHQTEWAFFPLYPWSLKVFARVTGLGIPTAMLVLAPILCAIWVLLALRLFTHIQGERAASWTVLLLLLQPFGIYFHLGMTESLFFIGLLGAFLSITERSWAGSALSSTVLVLTRPNGLFLLPVLLLYAAERDGSDPRSILREPRAWFKRGAPLLVALAAFMLYCGYQWQHTGRPFAFSAAQAGWNRRFGWPFAGFFNAGDIATQFDSWYTIGLLVLAFLVRRQLPLSLNLLLWISLLLPLFSGSVASIPRFTSLLFPFFLLGGRWLEGTRWRYVVLAGCFLLQLGWFRLWLEGELITC